MEGNTVPSSSPRGCTPPHHSHDFGQLPHPPSQDLPDGSPVAPPSHHPLPAFPTPDVTGEQELHPVCSKALTSGFHPGWGGGWVPQGPAHPAKTLCPRAGLDGADENRLLWTLAKLAHSTSPPKRLGGRHLVPPCGMAGRGELVLLANIYFVPAMC